MQLQQVQGPVLETVFPTLACVYRLTGQHPVNIPVEIGGGDLLLVQIADQLVVAVIQDGIRRGLDVAEVGAVVFQPCQRLLHRFFAAFGVVKILRTAEHIQLVAPLTEGLQHTVGPHTRSGILPAQIVEYHIQYFHRVSSFQTLPRTQERALRSPCPS